MSHDVGIVGGGAVGTTVAAELAARDVSVTLYDRTAIGDDSASSGRAAGLCYDAFTDPLDAEIASRSMERFHELSTRGVIAFTDCPYVWLARSDDPDRIDRIRQQIGRMRSNGCSASTVDPSTLERQFPALAVDDIGVAGRVTNAGYTDPGAYTAAMAALASDRGARICEQTPVSLDGGGTISHDGGRDVYDTVVVAAGAHTAAVLAGAGLSVPIKPYRVQALRTAQVDIDVPMLFDATGGYYLRPTATGGLFLGDGTEPIERDPDAYDRSADEWFLEAADGYLASAVGDVPSVSRSWAGLCTATPDGDPLVGRLTETVYVAAGWQGHGFMRAPAMGERIARSICGDRSFGAFSPRRFDGDEAFEIVEGMDLE